MGAASAFPKRAVLSFAVAMLLALASAVAGDSCPVSSVVLHCEARCAGVNVTSDTRVRHPAPLDETALPLSAELLCSRATGT